MLIKLDLQCWVPVVHTCNPSYSGGREQEDLCSKPAGTNGSRDSFLKKNPLQKSAGGVAQCVGPEFKPQNHKIKHKHLTYNSQKIVYMEIYFTIICL
jgi:hypothetical protein